MAVKYHISPETGRPNLCKAQEGNCPVTKETGGSHYATKDEARIGYESSMETFGNSVSSKKEPKRTGFDQAFSKISEIRQDYLAVSKGSLSAAELRAMKKILMEKEAQVLTSVGPNTLGKLYQAGHLKGSLIARSDKTVYDSIVKEQKKIEQDRKIEAEKEEFYTNLPAISDYKKDIARVIVEEGDFFVPKDDIRNKQSWGDGRGAEDHGAKDHFKECGVAGFNDIEEDSYVAEYDTFSGNEMHGIKAEMSCNCRKYFKTRAYVDQMRMGDLLAKMLIR